jgi:hypothetical protein
MNGAGTTVEMPGKSYALCRCDALAQRLGRPFCGYCGRAACPPALTSATGGAPIDAEGALEWPASSDGQPPRVELRLNPGALGPGTLAASAARLMANGALRGVSAGCWTTSAVNVR